MALNPPATQTVPSEADIVAVPEAFQTPIHGQGPNEPAAPAQPPAPLPPAAASNPIVVGDRTFASLADAQKFLNDQMNIASQVIKAGQPNPGTQPPAEVEPADILFEDPKTAIKLLKKQIRDEDAQVNHARAEQQRIESEFYAKHEDLVAHKDFVKYKTNQLLQTMPGFDQLPADQVFEIVASKTREELAKVRGTTANGQPLPDRPAVVAGGGGAVSPSAPAAPPAKALTFVDELKAARAKRAK